MNKLTLREAVGRVLLGMSAAAAGTLFQPTALAQEQARRRRRAPVDHGGSDRRPGASARRPTTSSMNGWSPRSFRT